MTNPDGVVLEITTALESELGGSRCLTESTIPSSVWNQQNPSQRSKRRFRPRRPRQSKRPMTNSTAFARRCKNREQRKRRQREILRLHGNAGFRRHEVGEPQLRVELAARYVRNVEDGSR